MITPVTATRNPTFNLERLLFECQWRKWGAQQLAHHAGISQQSARNVLKGRCCPNAYTLALIARALGISMDYFMGLSDVREVEL